MKSAVGDYMRAVVALLLFCGFAIGSVAQALEPVHPGDTLLVSVFQDPKLDRKIIVGPDGMVSFPLAGHFRAGGRTLPQLEETLKARLQKNYSSPLDITIALGDVNKEEEAESRPRVYITGEVLKPGPYVLRAGTNVMQALVLAGGLGQFAAKHRIQIHRRVRGIDTIQEFDYSAYMAGMFNDNIRLQRGDVIIVPERGLLE